MLVVGMAAGSQLVACLSDNKGQPLHMIDHLLVVGRRHTLNIRCSHDYGRFADAVNNHDDGI